MTKQGQDGILSGANADMLKRVRGTAKWSQLHKSGASFPPKHKVLFINNDDDEESNPE